ncbi:MAG: aldolase/citrate lyase family protein [Candidatus Poribacteria bacterium]|nr:aldolase/citrate lyase family protein [Candidatus Poribacteria bacterium]MDE0506012.1 aldolase/citrate lyase family protein [Candidatus Poribacteria bacterium]
MKRINRIIELLEEGQPVYWAGGVGLSYEGGVKSAQTTADWLVIGIEHGPYDITALSEFMRGLVDGGPTPTGHRTPPVLVTLPFDGTDEQVIRTNAWMIKQVLATGIHGILLCHAETPEAVKAFVEWSRYPFQTIGVGEGLDQGRRGSGGQDSAAQIWGIPVQEYLRKADVWPLNPDGELLLGVKIENKRALANVEASTKIPGIGFAEWGPSDMRMTFGYDTVRTPENTEEGELKAARDRVFAACNAANIGFLDGVDPDNVVDKIKEGVKFPAGGEEAAAVGRKFTNRKM